MIKLFVSDMDGTLLYNPIDPADRDITPENKAAVLKLHNEGVRFMMASGRDMFYRHILEKEFGFSVDAIGMNGCNVVIDNEVLCNHSLSREDSIDLMKAAKECRVPMNFLGITSLGDYVFQFPNQEPYQHFYELAQKGVFKSVSPLSIDEWIHDKNQTPFNKLVGLVKGVQARDALLKYYQAHFSERFDIIYSGHENIEIMPKHISKGQALLELMELKGYKPTEVAVIGDSMNDLTMLQAVPYSFAMSHSDDIIIEASKYVVHTVDEAIEMVLKLNHEEVKHAG